MTSHHLLTVIGNKQQPFDPHVLQILYNIDYYCYIISSRSKLDVWFKRTLALTSWGLKFPGCESQGGSLMWGLITAHLSGSVYSGLGETFWTSDLLFSVCSLHSITQESSPGGGSPCALLKVTIVAAQHLWFWGRCQFDAEAPVCAWLCFAAAVFWYRCEDAETAEVSLRGGVCWY